MTPSRRRRVIVSTLIAFQLPVLAAGYGVGFRLNMTPSYPLGLWRIEAMDRPLAIGDLIFICPPDNEAFAVGRERGYLRRGLCPGWFSPLIKTVVALPGQQVNIVNIVTVDGQALPNSTVRTADAEGRGLDPWSGGIVPSGALFLSSQFAGSYDSRYFGPIPASGLLGLARPVLTFDP